jgi:hypothetical protein
LTSIKSPVLSRLRQATEVTLRAETIAAPDEVSAPPAEHRGRMLFRGGASRAPARSHRSVEPGAGLGLRQGC